MSKSSLDNPTTCHGMDDYNPWQAPGPLREVIAGILGIAVGAALGIWMSGGTPTTLAQDQSEMGPGETAALCSQIEAAEAAIVVLPSLIPGSDGASRILGPRFELAIKLPPIKEGTVGDAVGDYLVHVVAELDQPGVMVDGGLR